MKHLLFLLLFSIGKLSLAQNVGIGTTTPNSSAQLHVDLGTSTTKGFLVTGTYNITSTVPNLGAGSRLMFYPGKAAFRAGMVSNIEWDNANVGIASTAMGFATFASGAVSTAMGSHSVASGQNSTAIGTYAAATGDYSTAMGFNTAATGDYSTAMGTNVSTNNKLGAFIIGDSDPNGQGLAMPGLADLFVARFNGGYYLYTSGITTNLGVAINHNGNAWVSASDQNLKENFEPLNGENVLQKLSKINFTSWNYKMQDPQIYRHYGIMAQDFYNAFGRDKYGTIGNDTTVNPIDMIGIDMAAIQALEKRTADLKAENETLKLQNEKLQARLQRLEDALLAK